MNHLSIRYSKNKIRFGFIYAIVCVIFGILIKNNFGYVWMAFGLIYLFFNYLKLKNQYIKVDPEKISIFDFLMRKIKMDEIIKIENKFGDYIIHTLNKEYKVHKSLVEKEDLSAFENYFENLKKLYNNNTI